MSDPAPPFVIEPLNAGHVRSTFKSGAEASDRYFASQVTQDIRRRVSACFVAGERGTTTVAGYYTIASSSIPLPDLAPATAKRMPRYPLVPAVRIGRLAVSASHRGKGIGAGLLLDGIARAYRAGIAAFALAVDAKDDAAVGFYKHHGFVTFTSAPMTLYLPLAEAARQLGIVTGQDER
jgi:ribosomal protein S18 acetylase RimI-like enzyme